MIESRQYPSYPIPAVSGVIVNLSGQILIVKRAKQPGHGLWSLPGGGVELGEILHDALRREIREECGISVEISELLGAFDRTFRDRSGQIEYHYVILNYLCFTTDTEITLGSDVDDFAWIDEIGLKDFIFTAGVLEFLRDGFRQNRFHPKESHER